MLHCWYRSQQHMIKLTGFQQMVWNMHCFPSFYKFHGVDQQICRRPSPLLHVVQTDTHSQRTTPGPAAFCYSRHAGGLNL